MAETKVSQKVEETFTTFAWGNPGVKGFLIGPDDNSQTLQVLGFWHNDNINRNDVQEDVDECLEFFPGGYRIVGVILVPSQKSVKSFMTKNEAGIEQELEEVLGSYNVWLEQCDASKLLVMCLLPNNENTSGQRWKLSFYLINEDGVSFMKHGVLNKEPVMRMRLQASIPVSVSTKEDIEHEINTLLENQLSKLQKWTANSTAFGFDNNKVLLLKSKQVKMEWKLCKDIKRYFQNLEEENDDRFGKGKKQSLRQEPPIAVSLLSFQSAPPAEQSYAPVIVTQMGDVQAVRVALPVDVLVEVSEKCTIHNLVDLLTKALSRQIKVYFKQFSKWGHKHTPEAFHFQPSSLDTSVTVVYPRGVSEDELERERKVLYNRLCLAQDKPVLRRSSAGLYLSTVAPSGYLLNTHIGLSNPVGKAICLVDGFYSYHHYMQDHFNDDKWGCAYRSLQTIVSWFKYQGYTDKDIPTHNEIQKALYDVGDKDEKFVGSRKWIGSFEVSYVLDHLLGVSSKFITVNAGAELASTGQQLTDHFLNQGTPVMIGGGVFAHTILGVAYDDLTGDISFLILDPHYTGGEDLKTIQDKGWCGWKGMNFWNQTAHYNLCLPQRPKAI